MALIGNLTEAQLADMTARVAARITSESVGMTAAPAATATEIAGAAVVFIVDVAPKAPEAIGREAAVRLAGWLLDNRPAVAEHVIRDPSGTEITLKFANHAATGNGFRHSGASALVSRYIVRRAGVIGDAAATQAATAGPDPDIGTTVMRAAFTDTLPFRDTGFRWIGTANGVELDTGWVQPAAFGLWLPNTVWSRVVAVVLLRSITAGTQGEHVSLRDFGPAETYQFGDTVGQIRYTPLTFVGAFSWPNDIRAVIGALR